jgi:ABC-type branched-subunit amino acid transport system substrate-binding protein
MSRIFLSHSSVDELEAVAVHQWLLDNGWDDVFLDLDPERGLIAGERWQEALRLAAHRCEAVIFLISPAWVESRWCLAEFLLAKNLHKLIFGVVVKDIVPSRVPTEMVAEWQLCYLIGEGATKTIRFMHRDSPAQVEFLGVGLSQLRLGLQNAGLSASFFPWPPPDDKSRAPYRGLEPFEAQDAAVFFGRDVEILQGLDKLRAMHAARNKSLFVILGASGAGKSSFLRAGLLPRLARDDRHFYALEVLRPEGSPLFGERGLAQAIAQANQRFRLTPGNVGAIKEALKEGAQRLGQLLLSIRDAIRNTLLGLPESAPPPTLVLPVDQAEELFNPDATDEARVFLDLIGTVLRANHLSTERGRLSLIIAFTIRSDRYEPLQTAPELMGLERVLFDALRPMPPVQFKEVITGPARRTSSSIRPLEIRPDLVQQLLSECGRGGDTLPLLSLTLARLYKEYGNDGVLGLDEYRHMGGMTHVIRNEIESILARDPKIRRTQLEMLHEAFIPWLVTIDPRNDQPRRRLARLIDLPTRSHALVQALIERRLLLSDLRDGQQVVEVAHESLLRQWDAMVQWLREEGEDLRAADRLMEAAAAWIRSGRKRDWLIRGEHLKILEILADRQSYRRRLEPAREFLLASRQEETRLREDEEQRPREQPEAPSGKQIPPAVRLITSWKTLIPGGFAVALLFFLLKSPVISPPDDLSGRLSLGEDIFFSKTAPVSKRSASNLFAQGKLDKAAEKFRESLADKRDDPEALIYLNNALAGNTDTDTLIIAVSVPIRPSENVAAEMLRGVAQAQKEVNAAGGIHGKQLLVKIADDDNKRDIAESIAKALVEEVKILAVVGHNASDVSRQAATVYQNRLVMISPTSFALELDKIKKPEAGNYIFACVPSYHSLMPKLTAHILEAVERPKVVVCHDSEAYDQKRFKEAISRNKKIEVAGADCDFSDLGFNPAKVMETAIKEGANSLFLAPHVSRISEAIDLARRNNGRLKLLGSPTLYTLDTLQLGQKDITGLVLPVSWHRTAFVNDKFYAKAKELWGNNVGITWRTAMSYDATQVIIEGLKRIPSSRQPSRGELQKIISNSEFKIDGATGRVRFMPSGGRRSGQREGREETDTFLVEVCPGTESGVGFDFVAEGNCRSN